VLGRAVDLDEAEVERILSPRHFVEVRTTPGGPAPAVTGAAIDASARVLDEDCGWLKETTERLRAAEAALKSAAATHLA
jgi:argininosuccinate lyase